MNITRRGMVKGFGAGLVLVGAGGSLSLEGCTAGDEFINILNLMEPAIDGVVLIVNLVDPPLGVVIQAGVTIFDQEIPVITKIYNDWVAASAAAQPGFLSQLEAALAVLRQDALTILTGAHVTDPAHQTAIGFIINAVLSEITEIASLIVSAKASGGTPSAAAKAVKRTSLGKPVVSASAFRSKLVSQLTWKSGNAQLDATCAQIAQKVKAAS
jgi:hypothetical protein